MTESLVSVYCVGNLETEFLVSISVSDSGEGYFSGHKTFSRDRTFLCKMANIQFDVCILNALCLWNIERKV